MKILLPLLAAAGFSRLRGGPKRLKTDPFEVKNAQATSNGTVLRVLKKLFGPLEKASFLKQFLNEPGDEKALTGETGANRRKPGEPVTQLWFSRCHGGEYRGGTPTE